LSFLYVSIWLGEKPLSLYKMWMNIYIAIAYYISQFLLLSVLLCNKKDRTLDIPIWTCTGVLKKCLNYARIVRAYD